MSTRETVLNYIDKVNGLHAEGVEAASSTAIIPIIIGDEATALKVADELLAPAIRYPTVAKGTARLRIALMATHTEEELAHTAKLLGAAIKNIWHKKRAGFSSELKPVRLYFRKILESFSQ